jgi:hypothetical protein
MRISTDGVVYVTQKSDSAANSRLWRWQSSAWTDLNPNIAGGAQIPETIFVDPSGSNPGFIGCARDGGVIFTHASYGGSAFTAAGSISRTPTNITWFSDMAIDPVVAGKLWFAEGIGVWSSLAANYNAWTEVSSGIENMIYNWLVAPPGGYPIVCCSDRAFFTVTNPDVYPSDYGPNKTFAIEYGASSDWATSDPTFIVGVDVWVDESNSYSTDKGVTWARFPTNVGGLAAGRLNGCIAASTDQNIVYVQANRGDMYQTQNRGTLWTRVPAANFGSVGMRNAAAMSISAAAQGTGGTGTWIRLTVNSTSDVLTGDGVVIQSLTGSGGLPALLVNNAYVITVIDATHIELQGTTWSAGYAASAGLATSNYNTGWPWAYFLRAQIVCADRVTTGTLYVHNWNPVATGGGIYKSTDGGVFWVRQSTKFANGNGLAAGNNSRLRSVPNLSSAGTGGHLLFTAGDNDSTTLWYSVDGGANWNSVGTGVNATGTNRAMGCGAVKPGNDYPSVYFAGQVNGVYGIWRSDNSKAQWATAAGGVCTAITWTNIGTFPLGSIGQVTAIEGDPDTWGRFYISTANDGIYYYRP